MGDVARLDWAGSRGGTSQHATAITMKQDGAAIPTAAAAAAPSRCLQAGELTSGSNTTANIKQSPKHTSNSPRGSSKPAQQAEPRTPAHPPTSGSTMFCRSDLQIWWML